MSSPRGVHSTTIPLPSLSSSSVTHESPQKRSLHHRTDTSFIEAGRLLVPGTPSAPAVGVLSHLKLSIPPISNKVAQEFMTKILGQAAEPSLEASGTPGQAVTDLPQESRSLGTPSSLTLGSEEQIPSPGQEDFVDEPEVSDAPPLVTEKHRTPSPLVDNEAGIGSALLREIKNRAENHGDPSATVTTSADLVIERQSSFFLQEPSPLPSPDHTFEHVRNESSSSMQPGQDSSESHSPAEPTFSHAQPNSTSPIGSAFVSVVPSSPHGDEEVELQPRLSPRLDTPPSSTDVAQPLQGLTEERVATTSAPPALAITLSVPELPDTDEPESPAFIGTSPSAQQDKTGENVRADAEGSVSASQTTSSSGPTVSDSTRADPQSTTSSAPSLPPAAWWKRALVGTKKFCGSSLRWMGAGLKAIFTGTTGRLLSNGFKLLKLLSSLWPKVRL